MIEFVNALTGGKMWVADERVEEYKAAGHKPAASSIAKPTNDKPVTDIAEDKPKTKRKTNGNGK